MSLSKVLEIARADLGYTENPPGSNRTKYWEAYDPNMQGQPWCVAALWTWFNSAGERMAFFGGGRTASCSVLLRWYKEQGLTVPIQQARIGDIAIYNFSGTQEPQHCGLITDVKMAISTIASLSSIEGNTTTTGGSEDNGGVVAEKVRYPRNIVGVARPKYKTEEPEIVDDVSGHWAEKEIKRCMKRGIIKGYQDGSFQPDKPVTRAEAAVMMDRLIQLFIGNDDGK